MKNRHHTVRHATSRLLNDQETTRLMAKLGLLKKTKIGHPNVVGRH